MKLKELLDAKEPLKRLSEKRFTDYKKMRGLVRLRKAVEQEVEFYATEERKAVDTYAEHGADGTPIFLGDGRIRLKDADSKIAFEKELSALLDTEVDGIEPITLCESDFRSTEDIPTPDEMIALEGVIIFED
ncbi:hypothetical protein [Mycoplasmopsis bovirhinis]|uniref:hypothetical protein n=1 Tax=Mycoplasmopsis bovirhinis TaxID=29553 RepID=UPI000E735408|nr:hypothetical protein [Mycoplasmopsis bovirhinis]